VNPFSRFVKRLAILFGRARFRSELDEEMDFHRAEAEKAFVAEGMTPAACPLRCEVAVRKFIGSQGAESRGGGISYGNRGAGLRFALRQMRKNPGFAVTAILILALGLGASVAVLDLSMRHSFNRCRMSAESACCCGREHGVVSTQQSFPRRLRRLEANEPDAQFTGCLRQYGLFAAYTGGRRPCARAARERRLLSYAWRAHVAGPGISSRRGSAWQTENRRPELRHVVEALQRTHRSGWQRVSLSGENYTIVGVLPREFAFAPGRDSEFWVPLLEKNGCELLRSCHSLDGVGRLRDGVTVQAALADLQAIAAQLERQYPDSNRGAGASVIPLSELIVGYVRPILLTLLAGAGLLLLIACVNVASLLLVRSESRRREIAVRGALGATPVRLTRQFVTEGLLLAGAGCLAGILLGGWMMTLLRKLIPLPMMVHVPFLDHVSLNRHTTLFAGAVALFATVLLAATPVLRLSFPGHSRGPRRWRRGARDACGVASAPISWLLSWRSLSCF